MGWRHANLHEAVFDGDIILATEHGWLDFMTKGTGFEPATRPSA